MLQTDTISSVSQENVRSKRRKIRQTYSKQRQNSSKNIIITIFTSSSVNSIEKVFKLQKRAARVILDADTRSNSVQLFKKLKCFQTILRNWTVQTILRKYSSNIFSTVLMTQIILLYQFHSFYQFLIYFTFISYLFVFITNTLFACNYSSIKGPCFFSF